MEISPAELSLKDTYKLLTGAVVPRPIAWVSTVNKEGQPNLAPFSFFNGVCSKPPTVLFCPGVRGTDGDNKDTLNNVRATEEFVINIVTEDTADAMNLTATELPSSVNEFEYAGVTPIPSQRVKPPRVAESPINIECKLSNIVQIGDGGKGSGFIVIGEVLHIHVADKVLLPNYKIDMAALNPIGRLAGPRYTQVNEIFELFREPSQVDQD
ncbi:MAG: flavin reductase family protein [Chloroflexi bacterium]|nr:MAG: flavin reductase family protein [Chloroflexota bacterium]MBL1194000.1 flavin reductase family protein [Chloroflexota bacterium]NOH11294.1 flavin reductase family protein [Chloroflexota bacterium]